MADGVIHTRYIDATVTTPAGTPSATPQRTTILLGSMVLLEVHLVIPAGHSGLTGWRLDMAAVTVIPYGGPTQWVIGDDDKLDFTFEREVGNGLQVVTYNAGQYDHTHYCRCKITDLADPHAGSAPAVQIQAL